MKTLIQKHVRMITVIVIAVLTLNAAFADDLNPPTYRGDPLSVHAHWENLTGGLTLDLTSFSFVDDLDPLTTLHSLAPSASVLGPDYQFDLPNWIDTMPVKYMRLQVTWLNDPTPPPLIDLTGVESGSTVPANIVYTSPVSNVDPTSAIFYQYYDIEFYPNPDFERWVIISPNAQLVQVVADTVSTVPEPATLVLLGLGGLLFRKRK